MQKITATAQIFFILGALMKLAAANVDESLSTSRVPETLIDIAALDSKYVNLTKVFEKYEGNERPSPNVTHVMEMINSHKEVIILKASMNDTLGLPIIEVTKKRECQKLLDDKIKALVKECGNVLENIFVEYIKQLKDLFSETKEKLYQLEKDSNHMHQVDQKYLEDHNLSYEKFKGQYESIWNKFEYIDDSLHRFVTENFKSFYEIWTWNNVENWLIPKVKACLHHK